MPDHPSFSRRVLRAFLLGLPGVVLLPLAIPAPQGVPAAALLVNPLILLLLASLAGAWAAPRAGLRSRLVQGDTVSGGAIVRLSLIGAAAGGAIALADDLSAPLWRTVALPSLLENRDLSDLVVGILYGGLTEEILLRWGLLSILAVGALRLLPRSQALWGAAILTALVFAGMHLPAVMLEAGTLSGPVVARTMIWNTAVGLLFAAAFVRGGLEGAIGAHVGFHLGVAALAALAGS